MSVVLMTQKGQQWLRLGKRECTILDAMLEWAQATAKHSPERIKICENGEKYIFYDGGNDRSFDVHRFDEAMPGIRWGTVDNWAVKAGQDSDWQLLFECDRGTAMREVRWATSELHGINAAHGLAPGATAGHSYLELEDLWREIGVGVDL